METSGDLLKFSAAVQITRPKSASHQGFSPSSNSPKQMKVAQLVLKKSIVEQSPARSRSPPTRPCHNINTRDDHKIGNLLGHSTMLMKSESMSRREECANQLKKPVKTAVSAAAAANNESPHHHKSSAMDEAVRREAREFMKKQKEKRKLETKKEEDDKSFIIKQRLEKLKITTRNVIAKVNACENGNSHELSATRRPKLREIRTLKLKPMRNNIQSSIPSQMGKPHDNNNEAAAVRETKEKESEMEVNPKQASVTQFPASPVKKTHHQPNKKLVSPLQLQNHQLRLTKHDVAQQTTLENVKSIENMKLKIPDVKLNITALSRHDIVPSHFKKKTPAWLQSSFTYPYPYNFIFAVKKKLEAYVSANEKKQLATTKKSHPTNKKKKKIVDDSEDMNTMSEISSIQSDMVLMRSEEQEKNGVGENDDEDDTSVSLSTLNSIKNDVFVGKKRESVNSEFDRRSFPPKMTPTTNKDDLRLEDVSPNTSEKRENFLSSTKIEDTFIKKPDIPVLKKPQEVHNEENDNRNSSHDHEKENDYRKMLNAFHQSLSQVIEVNNKLSTVINSKSPSVTSSSTAKSYSTLFERPLESDSSNVTSNIHTSDAKNQESSSIQTLIEQSDDTLKDKVIIDDPPVIVNEHYRDYKNNESTSVITSTTTRDEIKEQQLDNTLNDSKIMNILRLNTSFNENVDNYDTIFNKSTKEIHSWEKKLIDRMKGEIAMLELKKQNLKKHGHFEKAALMRNLQRTLLLRLEKEREKLRNASNSDVAEYVHQHDNEESLTKNEIERVLEQRENKLNLKRKQIERLIKWQQKLDQEEEKLKKIEQQLLGKNSKKLSSSKATSNENENDLNVSIEKVKSIDQSLEILRNIPSHEEQPEEIKVSGFKLNKLWRRLTGSSSTKFDANENFVYTKEKFSDLYEEARQFVLQSNFEQVLDISHKIAKKDDDEKSNVSTMNSIANIETEEEYPGSYNIETEEVSSTSTKKSETETSPPKFENLTFEVPRFSPEHVVDLNQSNVSIGSANMSVDKDNSVNYSNSFEKIDSSSVDASGSIIPEMINSNQITDMDDSTEQEQDQLIEDISFPDYETSLSIRESDENNRNNLSTITECTEYEQSQGSSEIYTDFGTATTSSSTTTTSESKNIEIQNRLISINESLSEVNEAFDRVVKPLSLSKANSSADTSSKTSENTIQFSERDVIRSTQEDEKFETASSSSSSTSDF